MKRKVIIFEKIIFLFLFSTTISLGQVAVTTAAGGTDVDSSTAENGTAPSYTLYCLKSFIFV